MLGRFELLDEVELYDLNARYYDPSIARFLTEDPYYNLGNRVMGVYEINVPNVYSIMQDNSSDHGPNNSHYSGGYNERKTDSYQLRLIVDYNLDLDCFVSEAVRLNTDNMIYVDNPVKINERENPYNPNNSVTFAYSPNINAVLQSGNLYVYCINNPLTYVDPSGNMFLGTTITFATDIQACPKPAAVPSLPNIVEPSFSTRLVPPLPKSVVDATQVQEKGAVQFSKNNDDPDPYRRPGQKKQGRENKNKSRKSEDFESRSNKRHGPPPPKHHTPGRDHRKYSIMAEVLNDKNMGS